MENKTFEDYLTEYHYDNNPQLLDDMLPDAYDDWIGSLETYEVMELAEKAIIYYRNKIK